MREIERTPEDVIRDAVRGLCGLPSAEIAWRVVDALEMAGYRIVPLRERTLTAKKDWRQRFIAMSDEWYTGGYGEGSGGDRQ